MFLLLASTAVNFAQRPSLAQSPAPAAPARSAAPTPNLQEHVKLQFPNSDVQDVLRYYEQLTGKRVITDNFVNGKVNIFLTKDPTREEAIQIIQISLLMNGFSLVPEEPDIVKVIGTGKNPRTQGVPIISDQADIPPGDQVVSYLFRLRYADPAELQQVIGQYLSPPSSYTSVLPLPKSSSILITENSTVIRGLAKIIEQIDVAPAEVTSEFIKLERADASKVCDMLKDIFEKSTDQPTRVGVPGAGGRGVRGVPNPVVPNPMGETDLGTLAALSEDSVIVGKIKLAPDVRTNRIHVITRPINMPFIRKLIAEFDANVQFAKPVTRSLRYISASDVLPVLVQALTEPGGRTAARRRRRNWWAATWGNAATHAQSHRHESIQCQSNRHRQRKQSQRLRGTFHTAGRYCAQSGHGRQRQNHRRPTRKHHHRFGQPRGRGESHKDSRRDGREIATSRAQHDYR